MTTVPEPTIQRLCTVLRFLEELERRGTETVSSGELGQALNLQPHSLRKDFGFLEAVAARKQGYEVVLLATAIRKALGLTGKRTACVVGLGRIGTAVLNYGQFEERGYRIVVGFDSNINKVETMQSEISLYPAYEIERVVAERAITLGILAVPAAAAQAAADRLIKGGVRGLLNFTPTVIKVDNPGVTVRNMDLVNKLDILTALISQDS